jgi:hypothetical protein
MSFRTRRLACQAEVIVALAPTTCQRELREADEVGEEDGDEAPLATHVCPRGEPQPSRWRCDSEVGQPLSRGLFELFAESGVGLQASWFVWLE